MSDTESSKIIQAWIPNSTIGGTAIQVKEADLPELNCWYTTKEMPSNMVAPHFDSKTQEWIELAPSVNESITDLQQGLAAVTDLALGTNAETEVSE